MTVTVHHRVPGNGRDLCARCGALIGIGQPHSVETREAPDGVLSYLIFHPHCWTERGSLNA